MIKFLGVVLIGIAVVCVLIARSNYNELKELGGAIDRYKSENPISTWFFGVTLTDQAQNRAAHARDFAYSFEPPLTPIEFLIYGVGAVGFVLLIWG